MTKGMSTAGTLHLSDRKVNGQMLQACGTSNNQRYSLSPITDQELADWFGKYGPNSIKKCKRCFG